jgi:phospholipid-translocating ATPase
LQEAHVGLGIMGKEGRAAVRAADFAFSKFHYLQKVNSDYLTDLLPMRI